MSDARGLEDNKPSREWAEQRIRKRREELGLLAERLQAAVAIDQLAAERIPKSPLYYHRELAVLPALLHEDERVIDLVWAHYMFKAGLLVRASSGRGAVVLLAI